MPVQRPSAAADNPYAVHSGMATAAMEPTTHGELLIRTPGIDAIVSAATSIFTNRWQPLVIGGLIIFGYNILTAILGQIIPAVGGMAGEEVAIGASVLMQCVSSLIGFYLTCGLIRIALSVARNAPTPVSVMFPNPGLFGRVILTMLIPILGLLALGAILGGVGAAIYFATGQDDAAGIGVAVIAGLLLGAVYLAMLFLLWPAVYLACDDRGFGMSAIRTGFAIGISNKLNSFLFMLINMVLGLIGVLTCCVGQIATTPATFLVAAVGYLMMTSQPVSDPSQPPLGASPPGFGNPGFGNPSYGNPNYGTPS